MGAPGCCFGCLKGLSKPVWVLLDSIEAVMVLTLIILKSRALLEMVLFEAAEQHLWINYDFLGLMLIQ